MVMIKPIQKLQIHLIILAFLIIICFFVCSLIYRYPVLFTHLGDAIEDILYDPYTIKAYLITYGVTSIQLQRDLGLPQLIIKNPRDPQWLHYLKMRKTAGWRVPKADFKGYDEIWIYEVGKERWLVIVYVYIKQGRVEKVFISRT